MDNTIYFLSLWELTIDAFIETRNFSFQLSSFQVQNLFDKTFTSSTRTAFPLGFPNFRKLKCSWSIVLHRIVQLTWAVNTEAISGVSHNLSSVILPVKLTEFATHSSGAMSLPMFVTFGNKDIDEEVCNYVLYTLPSPQRNPSAPFTSWVPLHSLMSAQSLHLPSMMSWQMVRFFSLL